MTLPSRVGSESSAVHTVTGGQQNVDATHTTTADTDLLLVIGFWNNQLEDMNDALFDSVSMTSIGSTTAAGDSTDTAVHVWGVVSPGAKTATARGDWGASPNNPCAALYCINIKDTDTASVAAATNVGNEQVNNTAGTTTTISSGGSAGNLNICFASGLGDDMTPASNAESWTEVEDTLDTGGGQGNNGDLSVYIAEKEGAAGITITWAATDENAGIVIELVAAPQTATMLIRQHHEGLLNG